jgi:hypothetical protein
MNASPKRKPVLHRKADLGKWGKGVHVDQKRQISFFLTDGERSSWRTLFRGTRLRDPCSCVVC